MASSSTTTEAESAEEQPLNPSLATNNNDEYGTFNSNPSTTTPNATTALLPSTTLQATTPSSPKYPTGAKFHLLMLNLAAIIVLAAIDMSIVATAVPRITDDFHTLADVGWYSIAFRLTQSAFQFLFGKAYHLYPIKPVFLLSNVISVVGSVICASAVSSRMLVVGRAVAGIGTAGLGAGATMMLVLSTPLETRPKVMGVWAAVEGTSVVSGPLLGGVITETVGWRWCFWINLPIAAVTLTLTYFLFEEGEKEGEAGGMGGKEKVRRLDIVSNLVLVPALTCLFLALNWAGTTYPWTSPTIVALFATSALLTAAFITNQFRLGEAAVLPMRIIKHRSVACSLLFILCLNSAGNVLEYYLPIYFQAVRGYTPAQSGYLMLPILIGGTVGAVASGFGTSAWGYYNPSIFFSAILMPIAAGFTTTFSITTSLAEILLYTGVFGLGYGVGFIGPTTAVQTVLPDSDVPLAMAALLFVTALGPAVAIAIAQVIFTSELVSKLRHLIPGLDRAGIEDNGLLELVKKVPRERVEEVLKGIDGSIVKAWYLVIALSGAMVFVAMPMEWRSVKGVEKRKDGEEERGEE